MLGLISEIYRWIKQIVFILITVIIINIFIFQVYAVRGSSMEPTFTDGDKVIAFKIPYHLDNEPEYQDIVVLDSRVNRDRNWMDGLIESPIISRILDNQGDHFWIKRVIGMPGDKIKFENGSIYRNGETLEEPEILTGEIYPSTDPLVVPENHVFVIGDNINQSRDSRQIGPVPMDNVKGNVLMRYYPFDDLKIY
ncbi:signal peptidase I [Natranaerobius thermophilus]|uniref:Signal peptidase I n=1 Tax=Natranaerobius thermophilus (strain ATCC BAA-1301 / DSM 18059 / JW/NM-WN-LF) TaxID=457570 RepID=B2A7J2_NATTJ|nr:signal peptidase I [Natranaerobius thermophilus]ACB85701.1 signal peptidase I [Natranaerobius thermophilus JW/NM-WN-LF]